MSTRLQVVLSEEELRALKSVARSERTTVGEWVRRLIRQGLQKSQPTTQEKLLAIERALKINGPSADIETMNSEISKGYSADLH